MELCPLSGKPCDNIKSYHITEMVNGKIQTLCLCGKCAGAYFNDETEENNIQPANNSEVNSAQAMLKTILEMLQTAVLGNKPNRSVCPNCNSSIEKIRQTGRLGCLRCYEHFGKDLFLALKKNDSVSKPEPIQNKKSVDAFSSYCEQIEMDLFKAIKEEKYEEAATIKSKIEAAEIVKKEKEALELKLTEAIRKAEFEKAQEIKLAISELIDSFLND